MFIKNVENKNISLFVLLNEVNKYTFLWLKNWVYMEVF